MSTTNALSDFPQPTLIDVNGIELEVFEAGREHGGPPVVLCHGWPELAFSWRRQIPALVGAGYHVIVPNQRGYGNSSRPSEVTAYDIDQLTGDLVALLDHYGYDDATFVGHDWGAFVVWSLATLHPNRVRNVAAISVPYMPRGEQPWIEFMETAFGADYYMVHFNRQPGVADAVLDEHTAQFLGNMFRTDVPLGDPDPGMAMINLALADTPLGAPLMSDAELAVYVEAFESTGFASSINWYRNMDRNWHLLADAESIVRQPALMIYGDRDPVPPSPILADFVPNVEVVTLHSGHHIQQERAEETNDALLDWLARHAAA